jgi:hypothetical protein
VDPVVRPGFQLTRETRIATAGSCFAQHIARALRASGFNYYVAEAGPAFLDEATKERRQYGLFSARYGNIYTARQLLQLAERAYGKRQPVDTVWRRERGGFIDPLRPSVEPDGFMREQALLEDRERHLGLVRQMFERLDVFVFTLGLTEGWEAISDGTVFPLAPGVVSETIDPSAYRFVNFEVEAVTEDLESFLTLLMEVNPQAKMILTVSPVPLMATYEDRHVLVSTTYSKAVLRVAAERLAKRHGCIVYFPSFEIVTGNHGRGGYFEDDLRSVHPRAVDHVMRLFLQHYGGVAQPSPAAVDGPVRKALGEANAPFAEVRGRLAAEFEAGAAIFCDEERLDTANAESLPVETATGA